MKRALILLGTLATASSVTLATSGTPAVAQAGGPNGAQIYTRCAACHTATGKGVPGAYPPLGADFRAKAASVPGRRYLVLAVTRGMMGPLTVEGQTYRGVMPAQGGLNDAAVAAVLNHIGTTIAKSGPPFRAFNAGEVATARASGVKLTPADVAKLHP